MKNIEVKQAVILAGGRGERLRPLTDKVPKPMVSVNNKPFLEYLIGMAKEKGIDEVVLLTGYLHEKIKEYFGNGSKFGMNIKYSIGDASWETGTRIRNAKNLLQENFLLMYGDNYWPMDLEGMTRMYNKMNLEAMVTVYNNKDCMGEYGRENNMEISDDSYVLDYDKKTRKNPRLNAVDIGFYILNKKIAESMPQNNFPFEQEILPKLIRNRQLCAFRTDHRYYFITNPSTLKITEGFLRQKKTIFLDRDGVINKNPAQHDYIKSWEEFEFLPDAVEAIRLLNKNNYQIYVITNQGGISRGCMSEQNVREIHENMTEELKKHDARIDGIYYCPHKEGDDCECRKPKPGMLFKAASEHNFDLTKSILIGDTERDIDAGRAARCKTILAGREKSLLQIAKELVNEAGSIDNMHKF